MSSEPAATDDDVVDGQEFAVTQQNTFEFLPGPLTGIACPCCFKDQLLKDVIRDGECASCGASLELSITAKTDGN
jgi:hypothetical protein